MFGLTGVALNGSSPYDLQVNDERFYKRLLRDGSLGAGESYMDGWWDVERLDELVEMITHADLTRKLSHNWRFAATALLARITNLQSRARASNAVKNHYDIGNDLYQNMLGEQMIYTCGYWKNADTLEQAQIAKMDLICKKLNLQAGQKILDIGCGWGSFAKFAAKKYSVEVTGITISEEQKRFAEESCSGLPVTVKLQDYRDLSGQFDHVVSIGMFEAVGHKDFRTFMKAVSNVLKDDGLFLLHTIGSNKSVTTTDPWIRKYIFQSGMLPSISQIGKSIENLFIMEDWHNFGADYDKTLMAWHRNFNDHWAELQKKYGDRFRRMWNFYLLSCAGTFRARGMQLWQIVLSKKGLQGGYNSLK